MDRKVMAAVAIAPIGLAVLGSFGDRSLRWVPTGHGLPPFHPLVVIALLALLVPVFVGPSEARRSAA
jgi:hypothetical protein